MLVQPELQQTPSAQKPLVHSDDTLHEAPFARRAHAVVPLHAEVPGHSSSGSVVAAMLPQVPSVPWPFFAEVHAWQVAPQAVSQHTPSTQKALWHSTPSAQVVPMGWSAHDPAPLHVVGPPHSLSGSVPIVMLPQTPSAPLPFFAEVHAWHVPVQLLLQQTPSAQKPEMHEAPEMQAAASGSLQPPAEHTVVPEHSSSGSVPLAIAPQRPLRPDPFFAALHARHDPVHAVLQQMPSAQLPLAHSAPAAQGEPLTLSAQAPEPLHDAEPLHSSSGSSLIAMAPHAPSAPPPFFAEVHAWQIPVHGPLQQTPSTQLPVTHSAPVAQAWPFATWQVPAPQLSRPAHSPSGSVPVRTSPQVPSDPAPFSAEVHAWQVPAQALSQHTPSVQKPLAQSAPRPQGSPSGRMQLPAAQVAGAAQSASPAHMVLQVEASHAYGLHGVRPASTHVPPPSQVSCAVCSPFVHSGAGPQGWPAFAGPHTPSGPETLAAAVHAEHSASQAVSQHTPDAQ